MASSLTSLGLGSQGALNYDIIDKLRAVDDKTQVNPLKSKISQNKILQSDLSILTTFTASLKAMTSSLSSETSYLKRKTSVSGDAATITAAAGSTIQEFSIDVKTLAVKDVYESRAFAEKNSKFISQADTIKISIDGKTYDIEVDATTTISQFKDKVFDVTDGKVSASILNVGGKNPYKLVVQSTKTGADNTLSITSTNGAALSLGLTNYQYSASAPTGTHSGTDTLTFNIGGTDYKR